VVGARLPSEPARRCRCPLPRRRLPVRVTAGDAAQWQRDADERLPEGAPAAARNRRNHPERAREDLAGVPNHRSAIPAQPARGAAVPAQRGDEAGEVLRPLGQRRFASGHARGRSTSTWLHRPTRAARSLRLRRRWSTFQPALTTDHVGGAVHETGRHAVRSTAVMPLRQRPQESQVAAEPCGPGSETSPGRRGSLRKHAADVPSGRRSSTAGGVV